MRHNLAKARDIIASKKSVCQSDGMRLVMTILRWGSLIAIVAFLAYRLSGIGWVTLYEARPTSPIFYTLAVAIFFVLPLVEVVNYRVMTGQRLPNALTVFSRKQVLNDAIVSYAGETYLLPKLAALPGYSFKRAILTIKDNTLISAFVSNSWTILLVLGVWLFGYDRVLKDILNISPLLIGGFAVVCMILYLSSILFFRALIQLPIRAVLKVGAMQAVRILTISGLQIAQWMSAIPGGDIPIWFMFLAVQTLVKRVPVNGDLLFLGVALTLPGFSLEDSPDVTSMLVTAAAMTQVVHFVAFLLTHDFRAQSNPVPPATAVRIE